MSLGKLEVRIGSVNRWLVSWRAAMETYPQLTFGSAKAPSVHTIPMISIQFTAIWVRHNLCHITKECVPPVFLVCFSTQNEKKYTARKGRGNI